MKRDPFQHWLLTFVTLGQYGIVWAFLMVRDVNRLRGTKRLNLPAQVISFTIAYVGYLIGIVLSAGPRANMLYGWMLALAFGLVVYMAWLLAFLARELREWNASDRPDTAMVLFLTGLCAGGFPLLQGHLNRRIQQKEDQRR